MMKFSKRLKLIRHALNLSQHDLSARLGVSEQLIAQYEDDQLQPDLPFIHKLASPLNVDPILFEGGSISSIHLTKIRNEWKFRNGDLGNLSYLSGLTDIPESRLDEIMTSDTVLTSSELFALSLALHCSSDWLLAIGTRPLEMDSQSDD